VPKTSDQGRDKPSHLVQHALKDEEDQGFDQSASKKLKLDLSLSLGSPVDQALQSASKKLKLDLSLSLGSPNSEAGAVSQLAPSGFRSEGLHLSSKLTTYL
jgi:hypothetical protein